MTTITTAKLREMAHTLGTTPAAAQIVFRANFGTRIDDTPADTDETEAQEAAMQDDVIKVAALVQDAIEGARQDWHNDPEVRGERTLDEHCAYLAARAAMAATREIDAEAMSNTLLPATWNRHDCADWLQQRANDVRAMGAP